MSGEVIAVPIVITGKISFTLVKAVKEAIDARVQAARDKALAEKDHMAEWLERQRQQQQQLVQLRSGEEFIQAAEQRLAELQLETAREQAESAPAAQQQHAEDYLSLGLQKETSQATTILDSLKALLDEFPAELRAAKGSPYEKLQQHVDRLVTRAAGGKKITPGEAETLRETIAATLGGYLRELAAARAYQEERLARAEIVMSEILLYESLAAEELPRQRDDLRRLALQLAALLETPQAAPGKFDVIEKRLATLKAEIDEGIGEATYRTTLCQSITRHLGDMGYSTVSAFKPADGGMLCTSLRIPGGERLQVALHANNQLGFQVQHESLVPETELAPDDLAHLHKQEGRWCQDLKELIRRLVAEGFEYNISFENTIADESVKVVVVETAEEIEEDAAHFEKKKFRTT